MEPVRVTLSANAGVSLEIGGKKLWVDALHDQKEQCFSVLTPELQKKMMNHRAFHSPDYICFTHCHGDHFSASLTRAAAAMWPRAKLFLPEQKFRKQILVSGEKFVYREDGITLTFLRLPHEGPQYADVAHYGLLISCGSTNVLLSGDCATASPALARAVAGISIDLAILSFPWLTLRKGREFIKDFLMPEHILLYHLPFEEDDIPGYRISAKREAEKWGAGLLEYPLQSELIK